MNNYCYLLHNSIPMVKNDNNVHINLNNYKSFLKKLIKLPTEYEFTFFENRNGDLISEFYKGVKIDETCDSLFNESANFTNIHCHTHPSVHPFNNYKYSPPSAQDFKIYITRYFKYYNRFFFVFSNGGVYLISLGKKIIDVINSNNMLRDVAYNKLFNSQKYTSYYSNIEWDNFINDIFDRLNIAHFALQQINKPHDYDYYKIIIDAIDKGYSIPRSFEEYLNIVRDVGFNIDFFNWNENLSFTFGIQKEIYCKTKLMIKARLKNKLNKYLITDNRFDYSDQIKNLYKNGYFNLNNTDLKKLYNILIKSKEGYMIEPYKKLNY